MVAKSGVIGSISPVYNKNLCNCMFPAIGLTWQGKRHYSFVTTPKSTFQSSDFQTTLEGRRLTLDVRFTVHGRSLVESCFEAGYLRSGSRNLTTRPPLPSFLKNSNVG
ncbi:hypothetical protein AVEN_236899-1 [Araneus ventricosus]|uniref:Uncharacterized protein n=1 Tax=Araneus ventricosus TaxID=182803 RepID=A0A4Y2DQN7_ARAVE|nr:hypothetical protein AVEN_236899-1 [Araneus ventricosus]